MITWWKYTSVYVHRDMYAFCITYWPIVDMLRIFNPTKKLNLNKLCNYCRNIECHCTTSELGSKYIKPIYSIDAGLLRG